VLCVLMQPAALAVLLFVSAWLHVHSLLVQLRVLLHALVLLRALPTLAVPAAAIARCAPVRAYPRWLVFPGQPCGAVEMMHGQAWEPAPRAWVTVS